MQITESIHVLEIPVNVFGMASVIHPVLILDKGEAILVDTGYPGQSCLPLIDTALKEAGASIAQLTGVILTHQDLDHIGGLPAILADHKAIVMAHKAEKPYIEGEKKLIKLAKDTAHNLDHLPEQLRQAFKRVVENPPAAKVDRTLADGEALPLCGGITVIHIPGHTPGHICLYCQAAKLLIAGDALTAKDGKLSGPVPEHADDFGQARKSLRKLLDYEIEQTVCYHGGLTAEGTKSIAALIQAGQ